MQAAVDWILIIFGTQVIKKKRPVRPVFPDYLSVSYDYVHNKCLLLKTKFENTLRNSNCNSNVQTFEISGNLWMLDETPHQTSPTWKLHTFASKHVGWNFVLEQTSSNIIQHDFFLLFRNFINFVIAQAIPTFHPTWQKRDVGWNIGLVCSGLYSLIIYAYILKRLWRGYIIFKQY